MENDSSLTKCKLFLLLLIAVPFSSSNARVTATSTPITKPPRLAMKLIHADSIFSPYYNPKATILERFWKDINSSMARHSYLNAKVKGFSNMDDVRGSTIANQDGLAFFANLSIGQPPVPQLVLMDTGSNIFWIQCLPCTKCFEQSSPKFDPLKSSTYSNLYCLSPKCISVGGICDSIRLCNYQIGYVNNKLSRGTFGMEELTFVTSDEGTTSVRDIAFGCSHETEGIENLPGGILGLAPHGESLVSQIGSKFSYCIGNIKDPTYEFNQLIIGEGAKIEGYSTPMEVFQNQYYLTLEGISVGEKPLSIDPDTFIRRSTSGGVMIDSGSTITFLNLGAYIPLKEEVTNLIGGLLPRIHEDWPGALCYWGNVRQDLQGFPVVVFHFAGGADLVLDVDAMFQQFHDNSFCMAVRPVGRSDATIVGIMAQQYYNVGYDLDAMQIYFQRIDCELYES